jgi:hypothetical protein
MLKTGIESIFPKNQNGCWKTTLFEYFNKVQEYPIGLFAWVP